MMFKRVVITWVMMLMATGMAVSTTADYAFETVVEIGAPVVSEKTMPKYTITQTPETFEAEDYYFQSKNLMVITQEPATTMNLVNRQEKNEEKPTVIAFEVEETKLEETTEKVVKEKVEATKATPKQEKQNVKSLKEGTIVDPSLKASAIVLEEYTWNGEILESYNGTVKGPNGKETYYNLNMSGVVRIMEDLGYNYEYSVREDGVKMYGPFIMVAADLRLRPRGSIIKTSLGWAMVCDTGDFVKWNPTQLDIAVAW